MKISDKPNIIWILGDQHRGQALSCMGDPNARTPNIDYLAANGVNFVRAVAGCPLCSPFRGSMLTSRYPHECVSGHDCAIPDAMPMISEPFKNAGYKTAYFGKWHVDGAKNRSPETREAFQCVKRERRGGFDTWLGYENNNSQWDCWLHGHFDNGNEVPHFQLPEFETDSLTELFLEYIQSHNAAESPFFAALSVQPPHCPYLAPREWLEKYTPSGISLRRNVPPVARIRKEAKKDLAGYYAMIENLDYNVGRIIQLLENLDILKNTYVIFFSDHGDMHGSHGKILKCVPWEESIRIPFIVSGGSCLERKSRKYSYPLNHVDIAPTTLGIAGIKIPEWMRGFDYSPAVFGRPCGDTPDSAFLQLVNPGWGPTGFAVDRERPWRGIVTAGGWKYAVLEHQPWVMYNLNEDPYELVNLALDRRYLAQRKCLQTQLAQWLKRNGDDFPVPEIS